MDKELAVWTSLPTGQAVLWPVKVLQLEENNPTGTAVSLSACCGTFCTPVDILVWYRL